ncbi:MAG: BON domain-containing protein [Acidobacteriota bacterium]|nr:BON domain-containing protein [Acidobacteriota bacterium]
MRKVFQFVLPAVIALAAACAASDPGISTAVKTKLAADDTVKAYQIDVDTKGAVVTLTGTVPSAAARDRALEIARATDGVTRVEDKLMVNAAGTMDERARGQAGDAAAATGTVADRAGDAASGVGGAITDASVTAAVKTRLLADPDVAGLKIDVDTTDKVVTLTGKVTSAAQKTEAGSIAKDTTGVTRVVNNLTVGR